MRMIVLFDLPVTTKAQRKSATKFRNFLLKDGYYMMQFSVYTRVCNGLDNIEKHSKRLNSMLPPYGSVRLLTITEKQYQDMHILLGKPLPNDKPFIAEQLSIF